jgi:hypothetical protein
MSAADQIVAKGWSVVVACIGLIASMYARAADPLISLIGPDEWNVPIVPSLNLFLQSGLAQTSNIFYDSGANSHAIPGGAHVYAGVTRFAHVFSFESLPQLGFAVEYLQPTLDEELPGQSVTGVGDPLFEIAAYFRPAPGLMVGYVNVPSIPVGSNELSSHFWSDTSLLVWNYHVGPLGFNGTFAAGVSSTQHNAGRDTDIGNSYDVEVTGLYKVADWVAPFVAFTHHSTAASHEIGTNAEAPGQGPLYSCAGPGGCHENLVGGGLNLHFTRKHSLALWYYDGINGSNVVKTKAMYMLYTHPF